MRLPSKKQRFTALTLRNLFSLRFSLLCFLLLIAFVLISKLYESTTYSFAAFATTAPRPLPAGRQVEAKNHSIPTFIYIPSLELGLPIQEATVSHGVWPTHDDSVSHIANSAIPGENGNTVIYGRNTTNQFGLLTSLIKGDEIIVSMKNGDSYIYKVAELAVAIPAEAIKLKSGETLTLYTPYGVASRKRFVVRATLK